MGYIKWNHIMNSQPEHGRKIIHLDRPYLGEFTTLGITEYYQKCSFEELLDYYKKEDIQNPDFWWVYVEDFPFPDM